MIASPLCPFSRTYQPYATAVPTPFPYFSKSPFLAHCSLEDDTYNVLNGYFSNSAFLDLLSKKVSFKNIAIFTPFVDMSRACSTNSFANLYGGFVIMSLPLIPLYLRKSIIFVSGYPLSITSEDLTVYPFSFNTSHK